MNLRSVTSVTKRRKLVEKELRVSLSAIGAYSIDEASASLRNCENMIGAAQVPLGIAGPLDATVMQGDGATVKKKYLLPLATTEGALVASVNRGCKAITESGGATVSVENFGATRGPVFRVENISEGRKLEHFIRKNFTQLKTIAEATSHHLSLTSWDIGGAGNYRFVRFVFDTGEAMGLNMVTIATDAVVTYIREKTGIFCIDISGNFCVDKKPAWQNFINRRGRPTRAEVILKSDVIEAILKTTAEKMYESWLSKCMIGSAISGSMGFNAQYANVIAAMFIALGQDPAHVVEGSIGITTTEIVKSPEKRVASNENDLYVSVYLPDLMVGTVGGGTGLATQREALSILGIPTGEEKGDAGVLAGIIGAACLAGEISLLASLSQGTLAKAHMKLGRGKQVKGGDEVTK